MGNLAVKLYTPKVYSEAGLRWIDDNAIRAPQTLPRARARARGSREPFAPWVRTRSGGRSSAAAESVGAAT